MDFTFIKQEIEDYEINLSPNWISPIAKAEILVNTYFADNNLANKNEQSIGIKFLCEIRYYNKELKEKYLILKISQNQLYSIDFDSNKRSVKEFVDYSCDLFEKSLIIEIDSTEYKGLRLPLEQTKANLLKSLSDNFINPN